MKKFFDSIIAWAYRSGNVDKLAALATNTTSLRNLVMTLSSMLVANGFLKGSLSETAIAGAVVVLGFLVDSFVTYARNKYSKQVQDIVGTTEDGLIGKHTVAAIKELAK